MTTQDILSQKKNTFKAVGYQPIQQNDDQTDDVCTSKWHILYNNLMIILKLMHYNAIFLRNKI